MVMKNNLETGYHYFVVIILCFFAFACSSGDETKEMEPPMEEQMEPEIEVLLNTSDLSLTIADDLKNGDRIGQVVATTNSGSITYEITSQTPANSVSISDINGAISVADETLIDATAQSEIVATVKVSNGTKEATSNVNVRVTPAEKFPKTVVYVEVNVHNMLNAGAYQLDNGKPFFDYAMIFGSNINYDVQNQRPILFFNPQAADVIDNIERSVKPLQDKGIKVLLSILGNRGRYGFANFPDRETAADFAQQVADAVALYNLDGVDLDDEFVDYGGIGVPQANEFSFIYLLEELRQRMPDKLITFYNIGASSQATSFNGVDAGSILDYSWQPFYNFYSGNGIPAGLPKEKYSASAINISVNPLSSALDFARRTKADGFGAYMLYNLTNDDFTNYLDDISKELYDQGTTRVERLRERTDYD